MLIHAQFQHNNTNWRERILQVVSSKARFFLILSVSVKIFFGGIYIASSRHSDKIRNYFLIIFIYRMYTFTYYFFFDNRNFPCMRFIFFGEGMLFSCTICPWYSEIMIMLDILLVYIYKCIRYHILTWMVSCRMSLAKRHTCMCSLNTLIL